MYFFYKLCSLNQYAAGRLYIFGESYAGMYVRVWREKSIWKMKS
jgi:carboxypeptidase C (cathepsin A)